MQNKPRRCKSYEWVMGLSVGLIHPVIENVTVLLIYGSDFEPVEGLPLACFNRQDFGIHIVKAMGVYAKVKFEFYIGKGFKQRGHPRVNGMIIYSYGFS